MRGRRVSRSARASDLLGALLVVMMSFQFGGVVILGKTVTASGVPVPTVLCFRFAIAGLVLAVLLAVVRQPVRAAPGEGGRLWLLGMICYSTESAFYFASLGHGSATAVTLLFFTYPAMVAVAGILLGRGLPGWLLGASLAASIAGAAIVVLAGGGVDVRALGVLFSLASALTYTVYLTGMDATLERTNSMAGAMIVSLAAAVGLGLYALVTGQARWPAGWDIWARTLGMGALSAGAFVCLFGGMRRLGALRTAIVSATEPLAVAVLAWAFLDEAIRSSTAAGGLLILVGAATASVARMSVGKPVEPPGP